MLQYIRGHGSSGVYAHMQRWSFSSQRRVEGHLFLKDTNMLSTGEVETGGFFGGVGAVELAGEQLQHWRMTSFLREMSITTHQMRRSKRQAKIVDKMRKAAESTVRPIPAIYQDELQQIATHPKRDEIAAAMPPLEQIKSSLYAHRRMRLPPLPSSRENICLQGEWTKTASGDDFLIADDGDEDRVLIFATDDNIRQLCRADTVYGDGTFQTCPRLFYQIFTLHIFCHGKQHPVLYALLPNKRRDTYQRMLTMVQQKATSLGTVLDPPAFLADFELAIKQAVQLAFPTAEYKGCYFHFCQALMRKVQSLGLQVQYQNDTELRTFIKKVAALAFVPPRFVRVAWQAIKAEAPTASRLPEFLDYFEETWLTGNFHLKA